MKYLFLVVLFPFLAHSACPPESIDIEYRSPVTHRKKVTCGYMKNGVLIKHGPETEFDDAGNAIKTVSFAHGEEGKIPVAEAPKPVAAPIEDETETFEAITKLLGVLNYDKSGLNEGEFKVKRCDPKPKTWVMAAMTKKKISKTYSFNEFCDVNGSFTASFLEEFPVEFDLRNLKEFKKTSMKVKMDVKQAPNKIIYRFEVRDGIVSSTLKTIGFIVDYEVEIDPLTGSAKHDTQNGTITLTKSGDKAINVTRPLLFNR